MTNDEQLKKESRIDTLIEVIEACKKYRVKDGEYPIGSGFTMRSCTKEEKAIKRTHNGVLNNIIEALEEEIKK